MRNVTLKNFLVCDYHKEHKGGRLSRSWVQGLKKLTAEPLINPVTKRKTIPNIAFLSRHGRKHSLRHAKYLIQIDFEVFYDVMPVPNDIMNNCVQERVEVLQPLHAPSGIKRECDTRSIRFISNRRCRDHCDNLYHDRQYHGR